MGKSSPSTPAAPDPAATSAAQTQSNKETALYNTGLNDINQYTPLGSITYNIDPGTGQMTPAASGGSSGGAPASQASPLTSSPDSTHIYHQYGANGQSIGYSSTPNYKANGATATPAQDSGFGLGGTSGGTGIPSVSSTITLNPEVQKALDLSLQTKAGEGQTALSYLDQVNKGLAGPPPTADAAFQKAQMDNMNALQAPFVQRQQEQLRAELAAKGVTEGSPAWHAAMQDESNALNNQQQQNIANATGQEQAQFGMQQAAYTLPLNEFSALQSGSQVQQPSFQAPSPVSVNPTNTAQNAYNSYNGQVANSNAQMASQNSLMSSLFGLGGTLGAAALLA